MREMKDSGVEWIGEIPSHWEILANKHLMKKVKNIRTKYTGEDVLSLTMRGVIVRDLDNPSGKMPATFDGYQFVEAGNLLMCLFDIDVTPRCIGLIKNDGVCSPAYSQFHLFENADAGYYYYYYLHLDNTKELLHLAKNLRHSLTEEQLGFIPTVHPPIHEQRKIVAFLDKKLSQVDTLICNVQAQIEKLKAYKQSLITEVVTKGLAPTVPMKDSGVEWIGKIPAHWEVTRIKDMFDLRNERNDEADLSKVNLISLYTDLGVVQHSDLTETTGNRAVTAEGYKFVHKNDIVVNIILCWMGAVGMSKYDGVTSPAYDIYRPLEGTNSEYYHYLFRTNRFNGECYRYGRGIMMMRWRTYSTEFRAINIPCPPADEQRKIVDYLNEKSSQVDRLIAIKQAKIEKLEQYKHSLIYEYVTGKEEVV